VTPAKGVSREAS